MKYVSAIVLIMLLLLPPLSAAAIKEIIAEGSYNMGDGETPNVAESRALVQAKAIALERAGTYVASYSKVKNIKLMEDEIQVVASGLMDVEVLEKKRAIVGDGINFFVRIKARINPDKMEEMAKKIRETSSVEDFRRIQEVYTQSRLEINELRSQLVKLNGEKQGVETKIVHIEKWFQANEWLDKGKHYWLNKQYHDAIVACSVAILLNPAFADAYITRGVAYGDTGRHDRAIEDFNAAIAIDPNAAISYYDRGCSYHSSGQYDKAIEDFNKAIALKSDDPDAYTNRGRAYYQTGKMNEAVANFEKACSMGSETGCKNLQLALRNK
jgi:tetratricopeptide (TPR) repeat protein